MRKLYERPQKLWDVQRIGEERKLINEYGLKNMRELWRMKTLLRKIRREARSLLAKRGADTEARKQSLIESVKRFLIGKATVSLDDVLALSTRDILERRLQSVVFRKGLAHTMVQGRQFVSHGHIAIAGRRNSAPSRLVLFSEEKQVNWYGNAIKFDTDEPEPVKDDKAVPVKHDKPVNVAHPVEAHHDKPVEKHDAPVKVHAPAKEKAPVAAQA